MIDVRLEAHQGDFKLNASFCVPFDGILGLVGASGSGKSTLFSCLAGHKRPASGRISLGEQVVYDSRSRINLSPARRGVGLVFQDGLLFPHLSVQGNLLYATRGKKPPEFDQVVSILGVGTLLKRHPQTLSGGERQRVAIGRALLARPRLLLLDEPVSALDDERKNDILTHLETVRHTTGLPMIYISHDAGEIARLADRVVSMRSGSVCAVHCAAETQIDFPAATAYSA